MADNPKKTGEPDRSLVAMGQAHEVAYWTKRFGVSEAKLKKAVAAVGNSVAKVEAWLKAN
ncbi:DUF3606 domain-containing protein [Pseudoxanthomonas mexicana]